MRKRVLRAVAGVILAVTMVSGASRAGQLITFDVPSKQASPLRLLGYLARPTGLGPFPAVVLLHGCGGFAGDVVAWADKVSHWGYVALAVDSFGPRGVQSACDAPFPDQPIDGYRALSFLARQPFVRTDRVAVMGFSLGGTAALTDMERGLIGDLYPAKFHAGIAFYPFCGSASGVMAAPTLILIGELDDWTPAAACREMVEGRSDIGVTRKPGDRTMVKLVVYPGAHHAFDVPGPLFAHGVRLHGHWLEYNEAATKDSIERVKVFLQRTLGD